MDVKSTFLNGNLTEEVYLTQQKNLHPKIAIKRASLKNPFMDLSKHQIDGTSVLMKQLKITASYKMKMNHVSIRRLIGAWLFCNSLCRWHINNRK